MSQKAPVYCQCLLWNAATSPQSVRCHLAAQRQKFIEFALSPLQNLTIPNSVSFFFQTLLFLQCTAHNIHNGRVTSVFPCLIMEERGSYQENEAKYNPPLALLSVNIIGSPGSILTSHSPFLICPLHNKRTVWGWFALFPAMSADLGRLSHPLPKHKAKVIETVSDRAQRRSAYSEVCQASLDVMLSSE